MYEKGAQAKKCTCQSVNHHRNFFLPTPSTSITVGRSTFDRFVSQNRDRENLFSTFTDRSRINKTIWKQFRINSDRVYFFTFLFYNSKEIIFIFLINQFHYNFFCKCCKKIKWNEINKILYTTSNYVATFTRMWLNVMKLNTHITSSL